MRISPVLLVLAATVGVPTLGVGQADSTQPERLFRSREILDLTLIAPLKTLFKNRDTVDKKPVAGRLIVSSAAGVDTVPVSLETRGHFRLRSSTCSFPPIKVIFDKSAMKETVFKGQGSLKLGTHCRSGSRYEQNLLMEESIYRIYNLLTPFSHRTRLVRIQYQNTEESDSPLTRMAFFIEDDDELAKRNGAVNTKMPAMSLSEMEPRQLDLMATFLYMIANHDWSIYALHNARVMQVAGGALAHPVAYDFDFSGLVNAPYAGPPEQLPIKTLRQRLYRGPCRSADELRPTLEFFAAQRGAILAVVENEPGLEADRIKDATRYLSDFFREIERPDRFVDGLGYACRGR